MNPKSSFGLKANEDDLINKPILYSHRSLNPTQMLILLRDAVNSMQS